MDCEEIGLLLSAFIDSETDDEELRAIEGHLEGCSNCRKELEALKALERKIVERFKDPLSPPSGVWDGIAGKIRSGTADEQGIQKKKSRGRFVFSPLALAASILLILSAAILTVRYFFIAGEEEKLVFYESKHKEFTREWTADWNQMARRKYESRVRMPGTSRLQLTDIKPVDLSSLKEEEPQQAVAKLISDRERISRKERFASMQRNYDIERRKELWNVKKVSWQQF